MATYQFQRWRVKVPQAKREVEMVVVQMEDKEKVGLLLKMNKVINQVQEKKNNPKELE